MSADLPLLEAARTGDNQACTTLLEENSGLVWSVARRYYGRGVEPDDLYQLGCLGFIKAVRNFDPEYGCQFSTYAVPKIAGEIRRFLRDDGTVKVSRSLREQGGVIYQARQKLEHQLGREPSIRELSAETGLEPEEIASAETANAPVSSLQMELGDGMTLEQLVGDDGMEERLLEQLSLREAVQALPEREGQVVALRYFRGLTQEKTARIVGVSQVQISRIEKKAMQHLRQLLT